MILPMSEIIYCCCCVLHNPGVQCIGRWHLLASEIDSCLVYCNCTDECVSKRYTGSYAAFSVNDKCYVTFNDTVTGKGFMWFDAAKR